MVSASPTVRLLLGLAAVVAGIALFVYGLAPAKPLMDTVSSSFSGDPPPPDLGERIDGAIAELTARAWADGLGLVLLLVGILVAKRALAKPAPTVESLVGAEVARRLAQLGVSPAAQPAATAPAPVVVTPTAASASVATAAAPAPVALPASAPIPAPSAAPRRTHCAACGGVLVAGGRLCPQGHPQA